MAHNLKKLLVKEILDTAMIKDHLEREQIYCLLYLFSKNDDYLSKKKLLDIRALDLSFQILIPSANHEFRIAESLAAYAVTCANLGKVYIASIFLDATNRIIDETIIDNEDFFLKSENLSNAQMSYLLLVFGWHRLSDCVTNEEANQYREKGNKLYDEKIGQYFGDKYKNFFNEIN